MSLRADPNLEGLAKLLWVVGGHIHVRHFVNILGKLLSTSRLLVLSLQIIQGIYSAGEFLCMYSSILSYIRAAFYNKKQEQERSFIFFKNRGAMTGDFI